MNESRIELKPDPDATFVIAGGVELSFAQVSGLAASACEVITQGAALQPGDKAALLMTSPLPFVASMLALMRLGAVSAPINTRLTAGELRWQAHNADCRLIISEPATRELAKQSGIASLELPPISPSDTADYAGFGAYKLDDDFAIMHSSGTSGKPKAAVLSYGSIYHSAMASARRLGQMADERWLCVLPLYHVGGLSIVLRSLIYGTAVEFGPSAPFDLDATNRLLSERQISLVSLVPTMLQRLLNVKARPWNDHLRLILLGGEAPSAQLISRCAADDLPIATCYGMTETASHVATALPELVYAKRGSVGNARQEGVELRVVNDDGSHAPVGIAGEVLVKGGMLMRGYYQDPAATAQALRDGWLRTGDIGYMDADGDLFILQRRTDLIVSGGENIYPAEVEAVLRGHPAIAEAVVLGLPDEAWGQRVAALIQARAGSAITADAIMAFARQHLAGYKIPRQIAFTTSLPRAASGKIQRRECRLAFDHAPPSQS